MQRLSEFEFGKLPDVMYHGADISLRSRIESEGLKYGYATPHTNIASEYGGDIYEIKKHPNMLKDEDWYPDAVYADNIPPSHVKRVGHVVSHVEDNGEWTDTPHWHKHEDCDLGYDVSWRRGTEGASHLNNPRPHPTNINLMVSNY